MSLTDLQKKPAMFITILFSSVTYELQELFSLKLSQT